MRDPSLLSPAGLNMFSSPLLVLLLGTLVGFSGAAVPMQQLGMRSSDISWRTCSAGFKDDSFREIPYPAPSLNARVGPRCGLRCGPGHSAGKGGREGGRKGGREGEREGGGKEGEEM